MNWGSKIGNGMLNIGIKGKDLAVNSAKFVKKKGS